MTRCGTNFYLTDRRGTLSVICDCGHDYGAWRDLRAALAAVHHHQQTTHLGETNE